MNTLEFCFFFFFFFLGGGDGEWWWVPTMGALTQNEWRVGDEGSLPNSIGWEFILFIKTHFYGGALTSHFMEEHSPPISIFPIFKMTSWNGNIFRVTGPLCGEFTGHLWIPLTKASDAELWCFFFICAWPNGWVNNQDADDLRRYRAHYDVTVMWCRIVIQWSGFHAYLAHCSTLITIPWN